jgi:hypothetical protein
VLIINKIFFNLVHFRACEAEGRYIYISEVEPMTVETGQNQLMIPSKQRRSFNSSTFLEETNGVLRYFSISGQAKESNSLDQISIVSHEFTNWQHDTYPHLSSSNEHLHLSRRSTCTLEYSLRCNVNLVGFVLLL